MTRSLAVGFANIGRGGFEQTISAVDVIAEHMGQFDTAALLLNEIDEADAADEHGLLSSAFRPWQDHAWDTREPILTKGVRVRRSQSIRGAKGVRRQSPARPVHEVIVDGGPDPDIVLIGGHLPAGAKNGWRAPLVRVVLVAEYARMWRLIRKRVRHHVRKGRHVVVAMDFNWRTLTRLHRRQGTLTAHGPDRIFVIPARGWVARRPRHGFIELPVEKLHGLLWAVVRFERVKPSATSIKE